MSKFRSIFRASRDDVLHSSGLAKPANKESFGSSSTESFDKRIETEQARSKIASYRHSFIASRREIRNLRAKNKDEITARPKTSVDDRQSPIRTSPKSPDSTPSTPSFREPPSRGYNPYQ